jgi:hypothetical protein
MLRFGHSASSVLATVMPSNLRRGVETGPAGIPYLRGHKSFFIGHTTTTDFPLNGVLESKRSSRRLRLIGVGFLRRELILERRWVLENTDMVCDPEANRLAPTAFTNSGAQWRFAASLGRSLVADGPAKILIGLLPTAMAYLLTMLTRRYMKVMAILMSDTCLTYARSSVDVAKPNPGKNTGARS